MTVYVDDMRMEAQVGRLNARWSHLMADSVDELVTFARQLGMQERWLQDKRSGVHFDVTDPKRAKALALGAVGIECGSDQWRLVVEIARLQHKVLNPQCGLPCRCGR